MSSKRIVYPEEWNIKSDTQEPCLVQLSESHPEFILASRCFLQNFPAEIVKIERVQNVELYQQYCTAKSMLASVNAGTELLLKHGTENTSPEEIWRSGKQRGGSHGFDFRFIKDGMYSEGAKKIGICFTEHSLYANNFRYPPTSETGEYQMFLAYVLPGKSEVVDQICTTMPKPAKNFQSLRGRLTRSIPNGLMIYSLNQAYPAYLVTYRLPLCDSA